MERRWVLTPSIALLILGTQNSRDSWNPGTENVDVFVLNWHGENNYIYSPVFLTPGILRHTMNCRAVGTVIVPFWPSAIFWPLLMKNPTDYNPFVQDAWKFPATRISFVLESGLSMFGSMFGSYDLNFDMLALGISFQ